MRVADTCASLRQANRGWKQRVGVFSSLPNLISRLGGAPNVLLGAVGLDEDTLSRPDDYVSCGALVDVLDLAAISTGCQHIGLLVGRMFTLSDLGKLGQVVRHSRTVGDALKALIAHQHTQSDAGAAFLLVRDGFADFGYSMYHAAMERGSAQMYDAALASAMNTMAELCGPAWRPRDVCISHSKPEAAVQYRAFFGVTPSFSAEFCALRFPAKDLERPVPGADAVARTTAQLTLVDEPPPDFLQRVYESIRLLILEHRCSGDNLADLMALHRRTLNRRLHARGVTFQGMLDKVRYRTACELLINPEIRMDDIAAALDYKATASFTRAFRRWTATTPDRWRRSDRIEPSQLRSPHASHARQ